MDDLMPTSRRPKKIKEVDPQVVWKLASLMCTYEEIADVIGLDVNTVSKHFGDLIDKGRSVGRKALRRAQFDKAVMDKDPRLLVWLGKQYLDQSENPNKNKDDAPLPWQD